MDGFLSHRDPYRAGLASTPSSAGYYSAYPSSRYQPSYGVDRLSSYALPAADPLSSFSRVPVDPYAGYGAPVSYQPELLPPPRYAAPAPVASYRPRERAAPKKRPPPSQNLGPRKKAFKQTQKSNFTVEKTATKPKKALQKKSQQEEEKPLQKGSKGAKSEPKPGKPQKSQAELLAKETQELHNLYRTGVDATTGKKISGIPVMKADVTPGKKNDTSFSGKKRKAEPQKEETKKGSKTEAPASAKKKMKGKKNKKLAKEKKLAAKKDEKSAGSTPVAKTAKVEPPPLTEDEKKEVEASLDLQRVVCKSVGEFLGVPAATGEPEKKEAVDATGSEAKPEALKPEEAQKPETLTAEEEKELEEKGFEFFSKLLEENQDIRKLYVDKCNGGTFECLVCHSIDAETSKKFGNLMSLVMHTSMRKQKRPEHRGYGRAVCSVLGWDPLKAPKIPRVNKDTPAADGSIKQEKEDGKPISQPETVEKSNEASDVEAAKAPEEEGITEDPAKDSAAE